MSFPTGPAASDEAAWDALLADESALSPGVAALCTRHGLGGLPVARYASGSLPVYAIGDTHVLKLFPPHEDVYASIEARSLAAVNGALPLPTPRLLAHDTIDGWHGLLMTQLQGRGLVEAWPELSLAQRDRLADQLGAGIAALHAVEPLPLADFTPRWDVFLREQRDGVVERQRTRRLDPYWLERLPEFLQRWMPPPNARRALLHTELMREHLMVEARDDGWRLSGLFDFEPAMLGAPEYDFASFGIFVSRGDGRFLRRALLAYGYRADELDAALQNRLMAYAMLHRYSNLRWYLERIPADGAASFEELAARWWALS